MKAIGAVVEGLGDGPQDYAWNQPTLDPSLQTWVTPQAPGVLLPSKFRRTGRYGLQGLSLMAKKHVRRTLGLMDEYVRRPGLWTWSLHDDDYEAMRGTDMWPRLQQMVFDLLVRYLKGHGDPALVLQVIEVGPKRAQRTGCPMPHGHVVLSGWGVKRAQGGWLVCPEVVDSILNEACTKVGLPVRDRSSGSRVERVKRTMSSYLSGYLSKGDPIGSLRTDSGWDCLLPHQWWNRSANAKALVDGHMWKLPADFAAFVEQERGRLEQLGLGMGRMVEVRRRVSNTVDMPVDVLCFTWAGVDQFQQGLEWFAVWRSDPQAFREGVGACTSLRTLACDGADMASPPPSQAPPPCSSPPRPPSASE